MVGWVATAVEWAGKAVAVEELEEAGVGKAAAEELATAGAVGLAAVLAAVGARGEAPAGLEERGTARLWLWRRRTPWSPPGLRMFSQTRCKLCSVPPAPRRTGCWFLRPPVGWSTTPGCRRCSECCLAAHRHTKSGP